MCVYIFPVDPVYYSRDSQVRILANFYLKRGSTALFTHLKIILQQCFQFSAISGIQTNPYTKSGLKFRQNFKDVLLRN